MKPKIISVSPAAEKILRARGITVDADTLDPGHSDFRAITRKTMSEVPVYSYRFGDLPIELSAAEVLANNRRRWEEFYDAE